MKTLIKSFATLLTIALLTINPTASFAQNGDPPPPPSEHGETGNQAPGGGAPVGDGLLLLILSAAGYGGLKIRNIKNSLSSRHPTSGSNCTKFPTLWIPTNSSRNC